MPLSYDEFIYGELYTDYSRAAYVAGGFEDYLSQLTGLGSIGINANTRALFVGCGLGFLMEMAIDAAPGGWADAWGTDTSAYIQALKLTDARADIRDKILDIDITAPGAVQALKAAGVSNTGRVNWVITDVVNGFSDAELPAFFSACESVRANGPGGIVHIMYPIVEPVVHDLGALGTIELGVDQGIANQYLNMKSADSWVAMYPTHYWLDMGWLTRTGSVRVWEPGTGWVYP